MKLVSSIFIYVDIWLFNLTCLDKIIYLSVMCRFCHNKLQNISPVLFNPTLTMSLIPGTPETSLWIESCYLRNIEISFPTKSVTLERTWYSLDPYHLVGFLSPPCHVDLLINDCWQLGHKLAQSLSALVNRRPGPLKLASLESSWGSLLSGD